MSSIIDNAVDTAVDVAFDRVFSKNHKQCPECKISRNVKSFENTETCKVCRKRADRKIDHNKVTPTIQDLNNLKKIHGGNTTLDTIINKLPADTHDVPVFGFMADSTLGLQGFMNWAITTYKKRPVVPYNDYVILWHDGHFCAHFAKRLFTNEELSSVAAAFPSNIFTNGGITCATRIALGN